MIRKIQVGLFLLFMVQLHAQSFINDGATIMLQENAIVYSVDSFVNRNGGQIKGDGTMDFASAMNLAVINPGVVIGDLSFNSSLENTAEAGFMMDIQGTSGIGLANGNDHVFVDGDFSFFGLLLLLLASTVLCCFGDHASAVAGLLKALLVFPASSRGTVL